jgi:hypothetical protein
VRRTDVNGLEDFTHIGKAKYEMWADRKMLLG